MTKDVFSNDLALQRDRLVSLGMLSAGLAHEINNPLAYVLSNLWFLSREILDFKTQLSRENLAAADASPLLLEWAEVVSESIEGAQLISKLVRDMKRFAHSEASQLEWFELQEVVESSLRILGHELKHRIHLEKHFDTLLPCLHGNPLHIQQVFLNLLMNAFQALDTSSGKAGKVEVALTREGHGICALVSDNGCGIPAEHMSKLFQPFFTSKPFEKGTGLGLFICKQLLAMHGGHIHLKSHVGQGTSVYVWLPVQNLEKPTEEFVVAPM
jgi:signal transduction histidine kinase